MRAFGSTSGNCGGWNSGRARRLGVGVLAAGRLDVGWLGVGGAQGDLRLGAGDAVIVLDLVGELQRAARLALGSLASAIVGGRSGVAAKAHCGWPEGARTCAVPSPVMVKCFSLVPLGVASVGATSLRPPETATSRLPPEERTIRVEPAGTASGPLAGSAAASLLAADRMTGGLPV